jgi:protease IV
LRSLMRYLLSFCALMILAGCGTPSFLITPVGNTNALREVRLSHGKGWSQEKVAIIEVEGMLMNARSGGFLQPTENALSLFTQQMEQAERDPKVKAVVLRINSPGGSVTTSDTMYQTVVDFRKRTGKPVVASTQEMAASGAYYVACGADKIVAQPTSVVGSIGVIFNTFNLEGTMQKIGARNEAIKSAPLKDMASPFHALSVEERAVLQGLVDEFFGRFKSVVMANRPIKDATTLSLVTDGRVFSGVQAMHLGLVDANGSLEDSINLARKLSKSKSASVIMYKRPYGYSGSIYASQPVPPAQANSMNLNLPGMKPVLPSGFYYLWEPG